MENRERIRWNQERRPRHRRGRIRLRARAQGMREEEILRETKLQCVGLDSDVICFEGARLRTGKSCHLSPIIRIMVSWNVRSTLAY